MLIQHFSRAILVTGVCLAAASSHAQSVERSADFDVFWPQLRLALLEADVLALDELSLSRDGVPFGYSSLNPNDACHKEVMESYLQVKLDADYLRPGGGSWREFLTKNPKIDLSDSSEVYQNALGEYSIGLKVRFAQNPVDGAWDLVDMLDDLDRAFDYSDRAGGPASC